MESNDAILGRAIENKTALSCNYQGYYREFCPHCLGSSKGNPRVLVYQFGGQSSAGEITDLTERNWRLMDPLQMDALELIDAARHTHDSYSGPGRLLDVAEIAVPW